MKPIGISDTWSGVGFSVSCLSLFVLALALAFLFGVPAAANASLPFVLVLLIGGTLFGSIGYGIGKLLVNAHRQVYGKWSYVSLETEEQFSTWIPWVHAIIYLLDGLAITALLQTYFSITASSPLDMLGAIGNTLLSGASGAIGNLLRVAVLALLVSNGVQSWNIVRFHKNHTPAVAISKGIELSNLKRYEEALAAFDRAIQLDPNNASAYNNKAWVLYKLRRSQEGLAPVERAIQLDPNQAGIQDTRGAILTDLQRYEEALTALDRASQLDPQRGVIYYHKGLLFQKLGQTAEAEQAFQQARALGYEEEA